MGMERTEVLDMMGTLKLYGIKGAYDEALANAIGASMSRSASSVSYSEPRYRRSRRTPSDIR